MKRMVLFPLAMACLVPALALASPAGRGARQRKAPSAQVSKEPLHVRVARAVFPREHWQRFMKEASAELTHQIAETGKGQIELAPGFADRLEEQYEELMPYEEMLNYQARLLDSQYSKAELRQLLVFYRTPLGRKSVPFMHDLMASSIQRAQLKFQNEMAAALAPLKPLVRRVPPAAPDGQPGQQDGKDHASGGGDTATGSGPPAEDEKAL